MSPSVRYFETSLDNSNKNDEKKKFIIDEKLIIS